MFYDTGHRTPRTIDHSRPPEPEVIVDTRTPTQKAADFYFDELMKREAREREEHKQRVAAALAKQQQAQAEQDRKNKQAAFIMQDNFLIEDVLARHPLTDEERQTVRQIIFETDYTAERAEIECLKIVAAKNLRRKSYE